MRKRLRKRIKKTHDRFCCGGDIAHHGAKVEPPLLAVEQHLAGLEHIPRQPPCKTKVERFEFLIE
jgi:hypothetical protein